MTRLRDLGLSIGRLPTGSLNAITDVEGVLVGHTTLIQGDGDLKEGSGPVRTGITAILPHGGNLFQDKVAAGVHTFNGFGKAFGFEQVRELGMIESPITLTNTLNIPRVADAVISYMLGRNPDIGLRAGTVNVVVGECNDGFLNDIRGRHVHEHHVLDAIATATSGSVEEGNVGAGTGTSCMGFKGGIGTASRVVGDGRFTLGTLVQSNFGRRQDFRFLGAPIGQDLMETDLPVLGGGSIMMVMATDAPLSSQQLTMVAKRAVLGLGRVGSTGDLGSGDFVIAFSTTNRFPHEADPEDYGFPRLHDNRILNELFVAAVETIEESVLNSILAAETMVGRDGNAMPALPLDKLEILLAKYGRLDL
jgi:D-aminopeptidase